MSKTTVKLFSQNRRTIGTTCNLPLIGRVTFDPTDNSIEVESSKIEELRTLDFGIKLLTAEEQKAAKQKTDAATKKPATPTPSNQPEEPLPLATCLEMLKKGRSAEDQALLDLFVEQCGMSDESSQKNSLEADQKAAIEMLKALSEKEIDKLLAEYPKADIKTLKTLESKIDFLVVKMTTKK